MIFPVVMYGCKSKEGWVPKNWCFWIVLEKSLRVPWMVRRSNQSILKENQPWIFIGRTDTETEAPVLWPPDAKGLLISKDPDAGKDWKQEEKGWTEDEIVGWQHQLSGHGFEQTLGDGEGQGSLAGYSPEGCRVGHDWATKQQRIYEITKSRWHLL